MADLLMAVLRTARRDDICAEPKGSKLTQFEELLQQCRTRTAHSEAHLAHQNNYHPHDAPHMALGELLPGSKHSAGFKPLIMK